MARDKVLVERKAALAYEPADEEAAAELRALLDGFADLHAGTLAALDRADAALDAALAHFGRRSA
jgi:hypothetical protein